MSYLQQHGTRQTPQSEPIPGSNQVANSAGGFAWTVDSWTRLRRFLILGAEGGSYYASERKLAQGNIGALGECLDADGRRTVDLIVNVSDRGLAPKNREALFALAVAASHTDDATRAYALSRLPEVARTGTHLFEFVGYVEQFRGWGRGLKRAVAAWYLGKTPGALAYQLAKYQQRDGWSHADLLVLARDYVRPERGGDHDRLFAWAVGKAKFHPSTGAGTGSPLIEAMVALQADPTEARAVAAVEQHGLSREMIPSDLLTRPNVWGAMLDRGMPLTAMIRNLGNMTRIGLLDPMGDATQAVLARLGDADAIRKARVHPIALLIAQRTYMAGHGLRGKHTWTPVPQIVDALDAAFYLAFENVEPTGKRTLLALDVSGSMATGAVAGVPGLTPRDASAALALVTASVEPRYEIMGFGHAFQRVGITPGMRLSDAIRVVSGLPFGNTDCAIPVLWAAHVNRDVDTFVVYTDSETWYGQMHPSQALQKYRRSHVAAARLAVVGMVANEFTIADPQDPGMLDVVGMDASVPQLLAEFSAGGL